MIKQLILLILFILPISFCIGQNKVRIDDSCLIKNSILLAKELIETFGEEKVTNLLENDIRILLFLKVDREGNTLYFKDRINNGIDRSKKQMTRDSSIIRNLSLELKNLLSFEKNYFYICYNPLPETNYAESIEIISRDLFKESDHIIINVVFPGELLLYYNGGKGKGKRKGQVQMLSKLDYIKELITTANTR